MEENIQKCTNCNQTPDDILMLGCDHDLCLNCAALIFISENPDNTDGRLLTCLECGQSTELDESSVSELHRVHMEFLISNKYNTHQSTHSRSSASVPLDKRNTRQEPMTHSSAYTSDGKRDIDINKDDQLNVKTNGTFQESNIYVTQPSYSQHSSSRYQYSQPQKEIETDVNQDQINQSDMAQMQMPQKRYCQEHREEEILYFCFQCQTRCICPECVIHGAHKNHEVKTIKKAYPMVKQKVEEFQQKLDFKYKQISQRKAQLDALNQELEGNTYNLKKQISLTFSELRQKIDAKEREITQLCDQVLAQNIKELEELRFLLEEKHIEFKSITDLVYDHAEQPDETLLLDFYATNRAKLDEIKENREWEQKLIFETPAFYQISSRDIQKILALIEGQIDKINPQIEANDTLNMRSLSDQISPGTSQPKEQKKIKEYIKNSMEQSQDSIQKRILTNSNQYSVDRINPQGRDTYQPIQDDVKETRTLSNTDFERFREKIVSKHKSNSSPSYQTEQLPISFGSKDKFLSTPQQSSSQLQYIAFQQQTKPLNSQQNQQLAQNTSQVSQNSNTSSNSKVYQREQL